MVRYLTMALLLALAAPGSYADNKESRPGGV